MIKIKNILGFFKKKKILVTHPHNFHIDDVFSCAALMILLEKKGMPYKVVRTREEGELEKYKNMAREEEGSVFIFDVGGEYEEENNLFDHHQKEGAGVRPNGVSYSSFGLVWKKYGEEICGLKEISERIDYHMVTGIDANDTGFTLAQPLYDFSLYGFPSLKNSFFPISGKKKDFDKAFLEVVEISKRVLKNEISWAQKKIDDEQRFEEIYTSSLDKRVIWIEEDISIGKLFPKHPEILFLVKKKEDGTWVIISTLKSNKSKESKKYMPKEWGGLSGLELEEASKIVGAKFCHRGLWIAAAASRGAAERMTEAALKG
jgi:uncharacterized UPF0160 family protein